MYKQPFYEKPFLGFAKFFLHDLACGMHKEYHLVVSTYMWFVLNVRTGSYRELYFCIENCCWNST